VAPVPPVHFAQVNGQPIYMKGANLVPQSVLPTNVTAANIADLLQYALDSNMNMIRVWGGGMYPVRVVGGCKCSLSRLLELWSHAGGCLLMLGVMLGAQGGRCDFQLALPLRFCDVKQQCDASP
jgi:hypothetical protein